VRLERRAHAGVGVLALRHLGEPDPAHLRGEAGAQQFQFHSVHFPIIHYGWRVTGVAGLVYASIHRDRGLRCVDICAS
jgi:hypothetical protein